MTPVIETNDLTKIYGHRPAVDGLSLTVGAGEIFGFLGPNGAGKTTSLLMLLGLTEPSRGWARVLGMDPLRDPLKIKRQVGYLPENVGFYGDMTGWENLEYVARLNGLDGPEMKARMEEALARVELKGEEHKLTSAYSRGMRQRLGIAELLVKSPRIVFLDEPALGLDPDGMNKMLELIQSLSRDQGMTVVLSSHMLDQVQRICHRVGIMLHGKMVAMGAINDLAREKMGQEAGEANLEELYMRYYREG